MALALDKAARPRSKRVGAASRSGTMAPHAKGADQHGGQFTPSSLESMRKDFDGNDAYRVAMNAVTQTAVDDVALSRSVVAGTDFSFSHRLDDWGVTHQKQTGLCWIFAGLNLLRVGAMKRMNLDDFEFSQNHILFWDKLERSNYFLETIIATADLPTADRAIDFLLSSPIADGGQWNMFVNIVRRHGLVPKPLMPDTESSTNTRRMNNVLAHKLREGALVLRGLLSTGGSVEGARAAKRELLSVIHRILCIHLGRPPMKVEWQWRDKKRKFHRDPAMTPQEFARKYVTIPIDDYVCLVHDPRPTSLLERTFTVQYLGNMVGAADVLYLNVEIGLMKRLAMDAIRCGEPVWMGCDVAQMMRRDLGVWDRNLYDFETLYNTAFSLNKAERLAYRESALTHAMLITGVDVIAQRPRRWRVENSWGEEKSGRKGFFVMNDSWFDEYVFEVVVRRTVLSAALRDALKTTPIVLPPWDPMGALARKHSSRQNPVDTEARARLGG